MTKTIASTALIAFLTMAAASAFAAVQLDAASENPAPARYWLHPKLGMVRINPSSPAQVSVQTQPTDADTQNETTTSPTPEARATRYWLHPKLGMVRVDAVTNAMITSTAR